MKLRGCSWTEEVEACLPHADPTVCLCVKLTEHVRTLLIHDARQQGWELEFDDGSHHLHPCTL